MKNILGKILLVVLLFGYVSADDDWKFVCAPYDLLNFGNERYFPVSGNENFSLIIADSKTIQIDKKNKTIKVWIVWLASQNGKDYVIQALGKYDNYNNYGYDQSYFTIDYTNMQIKIISTSNMNCDGSVIYSMNVHNKWRQIAPDSVMEEITASIVGKYNLK